MNQEIEVVIVGGGAAGIGIAQTLDKKGPATLSVTLVTEFDYLRHHPATLRAVVTAEGELEKHITAHYDKIFGKNAKGGRGRLSKVKIGKVVSVEETSNGGYVHLEGGERLRWDYMVIATGSEWNGPLRWPERLEDVHDYLEEWRDKFSAARSVVVVGAGAVGVELAGEICDFVPEAKVSIVQKERLPLNPTYPDVFRQRLATELEARGVKVVLNDTVQLLQSVLDGTDPVTPGRTVTTTKGVILPAELIVATAGRRGVNTSFLRLSPSLSKTLDDGGYVKVTQTLQTTTNPRVFAAGDVVAIPEQHTLVKAHAHSSVIAANILTLINTDGRPVRNLAAYVKPTDGIGITNGRTRGAMYLDMFTFFGRPVILGNWLSALIKSKGLLVFMFKGMMNS